MSNNPSEFILLNFYGQLSFSDGYVVDTGAVREETTEAQGVGRGLKGEVIVRLGLRGDEFVEGMVEPKIGIADVPGDTREDVERPRRVSLEVPDMAAVPIGVQVCGEHGIDAEFIEKRHERNAFLADTLQTFGKTRDTIMENVPMREDDLPLFVRGRDILREPRELFIAKPWDNVVYFLPHRIENGKMDVAEVEGIIIARKVDAAVVRHVEKREVG